jgi:DNA-binding Xre family transcriptional regulator
MSETENIIADIRSIMLKNGISVKELSKRLEKSQSATSGLLNQKNISLEMLNKICNALGCNLEICIVEKADDNNDITDI